MEMLLTRLGPGPWAVSLLIRRMLARNIHALEYDPHVQYRFHQSFMWCWAVCLVGNFFVPTLWNHQLGILIVQEISFYANFSTDFGAMSSALAAGNFHCVGCNCNKAIPPAEF